MSSTTRRFGTDVSNIPPDVLHKTPSKKINKSQSTSKTKRASSLVKEPKSSPLFDVMESLMDTINIAIDDEISVKSPVRLATSVLDEFRYERDFLLKFRDMEFCIQPIDGLLPEVLPSFIHPEPRMDSSSKPLLNLTARKLSKTIPVTVAQLDTPLSSQPISQAPSETSSEIMSINPKEWRIKPARKQKPREEDARRLAARQKQINIGMNTVGYKKFMEMPASMRSKDDPKIPDIHQVCSKRSWDGQVKKWRKGLHKFDPNPESAGDEQLDEQNAADQHANSNPSLDDEYSDDEDI